MAKKSTDFSAALTGLIMGAAVMFLLVFAIVTMTNKKFEGHKTTPGAAEGSQH